MNSEEPGRFYRRLEIGSLTCALRDLNSSLDTGAAENVTFHEINDHLDRGNLIEHLQERLGRSFSTVRPEVEQGKLLIEGLTQQERLFSNSKPYFLTARSALNS